MRGSYAGFLLWDDGYRWVVTVVNAQAWTCYSVRIKRNGNQRNVRVATNIRVPPLLLCYVTTINIRDADFRTIKLNGHRSWLTCTIVRLTAVNCTLYTINGPLVLFTNLEWCWGSRFPEISQAGSELWTYSPGSQAQGPWLPLKSACLKVSIRLGFTDGASSELPKAQNDQKPSAR